MRIVLIAIVLALGCDAARPTDHRMIDSPVFGEIEAQVGESGLQESWTDGSDLRTVWTVGGSQQVPSDEFDTQNGAFDAIQLDGGRMLVLDRHRVRVFSADAQEQVRIGRRGEGPEEFGQLIGGCVVHGDTIMVHDTRNRRFAVLDLARGRILRVMPSDRWTMQSQSCGPEARVLVSSRGPMDQVTMSRPLIIGNLDPRTGLVDTLVGLRVPSYSKVAGGDLSIAATSEGFVVTDPWSNLISDFTPSGALTRTVLPAWREELSSGEIENRSTAVAPGGSGPSGTPTVPVDGGSMLIPYFEWVEVAPDGMRWLLRPLGQNDSTYRWTCITDNGQARGGIVLRARPFDQSVRLLGVLDSGLLLWERDENGAFVLRVAEVPGRCRKDFSEDT